MNTSNAWVRSVVVLVAAAVISGCATKALQQERNALRQENLDLRDTVDTTRAALEAADLKRQELEDANTDLQARNDKRLSSPPTLMATAANTGFENIPGVEASQAAGRITVRISGDVLFDSGKVSLKSSARKTLDRIAGVIKSDYSSNKIHIAGHTDRDPIRKSKWTDNLELSGQRAMTVHRHLQKRGIGAEQMYAAAYGQWHPRESKSKSRRVEIIVDLN